MNQKSSCGCSSDSVWEKNPMSHAIPLWKQWKCKHKQNTLMEETWQNHSNKKTVTNQIVDLGHQSQWQTNTMIVMALFLACLSFHNPGPWSQIATSVVFWILWIDCLNWNCVLFFHLTEMWIPVFNTDITLEWSDPDIISFHPMTIFQQNTHSLFLCRFINKHHQKLIPLVIQWPKTNCEGFD